MTDVQTNHRPKPQRENNFNVIRLVAALFVMAGHMGHIAGTAVPAFAGKQMHTIGVSIFFIIGGYLIATSWASDPHPIRYAIKRFVRIWPPLAVLVLLMTYVAGPLLSELGPAAYFQSWYTAFLGNLRLFIVFALPGVFTNLPYPNVVNGSLWTIPVEVALYVLCPLILCLVGFLRKDKARHILLLFLAGAAVLAEVLRLLYLTDPLIFYATSWSSAWPLITYFLVGMVYTIPAVRKLLHLQWAVLLLLILSCVNFSAPVQTVLFYLILPYFIFSFAFASQPVFSRVCAKYELSYGIYLYGFFFQQLAVWYGIRHQWSLSFMQLFIISLIPTLLAAWLSCVLIEKPLIRLSSRLLARWKQGGKTAHD